MYRQVDVYRFPSLLFKLFFDDQHKALAVGVFEFRIRIRK